MTSIKVCYVDDQAGTDAKRFQERLSRGGDIECQLAGPPTWQDLERLWQAEAPDLYLIDYVLNTLQEDGTKASYQGTTLSAEIRTRLPDCPIILITRETILQQLDTRTRRQLAERMQVFDELILKDSIDDDLESCQYLLVSMARGFQTLSSSPEKTFSSLIAALGATEEEANALREAAPPLAQGEWITSGAAQWIRNVVLAYPGILYDPLYSAMRLGLDVSFFQRPEVLALVEPAKYQGVFAPREGRWWKDRLLSLAKEIALGEDVNRPINLAFPEVVRRRTGLDPVLAVCTWDHKPVADAICYIRREPVKMKHSLRYYPDDRPSIMEHARVSFRAIRESNKFSESLLDSEGVSMLPEIEHLDEP
jgi:hypothetical protein